MKAEILRHRIFIFGILLLAISLPTSKFGMSLSQMILAANWLIDKKLTEKFNSFVHNKTALIFSLIFIIHTLWLANTVNFDYALLDLKTKSPILILAIIFSTTPSLSFKEFKWVLFAHISSVLLMTFIGFYIYYEQRPTDFREISPFISHIRLALNICISIFTLLYFTFNDRICKETKNKFLSYSLKTGMLLLVCWFMIFLSMLQSATGIFIVIGVGLVLLLRLVFKLTMNKTKKRVIISLVFITPLVLGWLLYNSFQSYMFRPTINLDALEKTTVHGGKYIHDTLLFTSENQHWIGVYLCEPELEYAWNLRSKTKYNTKDERGNIINYTLIRYLTSKELRKDQEGVNALSDKDIVNIEKGIANINYTKGIGLKARLEKLFWEYLMNKTNGDIKGHSLFQRLELWKISVDIIKQNWLFGVGTGDVPDTFKQKMIEKDSPLKETRMRSHNQYLSLLVAFGIFGFLGCLFSLIYPFVRSKSIFDYFCLVFLLIFFVSMLTEDTIESQDGVTFYAFFASLYLFQKPKNRMIIKNETND